MSNKSNNCNKSVHVTPISGTQKRFTLLEHNSRAIRDILLGTNIHMEDAKDTSAICQILNDMNHVAVKLSEAKLQDRRQRIAIAELSLTIEHLRKTVEIQDMQLETFQETIADQDSEIENLKAEISVMFNSRITDKVVEEKSNG